MPLFLLALASALLSALLALPSTAADTPAPDTPAPSPLPTRRVIVALTLHRDALSLFDAIVVPALRNASLSSEAQELRDLLAHDASVLSGGGRVNITCDAGLLSAAGGSSGNTAGALVCSALGLSAVLSPAAIDYLLQYDLVTGVYDDVTLRLSGGRGSSGVGGLRQPHPRFTGRLPAPAHGGHLLRFLQDAQDNAEAPAEDPADASSPLTGVAAAAGANTQESAPYQLGRIDSRGRDGTSEYTYTDTGAGVTVYMIDSGINTAHSEFAGRIVAGQNFAPDQAPEDYADCAGHGTHTAGIAAGSKYGVAKSASIVVARAYDCTNEGPLSQTLSAINYVLAQMASRGGRAVVNMSFGGPRNFLLDSAVARLTQGGAVVVAAAGNDKTDACGDSPAGSPGALTVAASDKGDNFASFSNAGPCVDIVAPGVDIKSAWVGSPTATKTMSGTSMAAPVVTGVAALYLQANPRASQGDVAQNVVCSASVGELTRVPANTPNRLVYSPPGGWEGQACVPQEGPGSNGANPVSGGGGDGSGSNGVSSGAGQVGVGGLVAAVPAAAAALVVCASRV